MIPYGKQEITQQDIDAVVSVLNSAFLTQGPKVPEFENAVAQYTKSQFGVAVNSATSALHIACLALDLGAGDSLWTSPNTFVASANCGLYCGANVDFVDIDPKTYNLCVDSLEKKLIKAEAEGKLPKIVVPVHFAGQSCDMKRISELGQKYGFRIIEDASHAIGGKYLDEPIGGCQYSDITIFSFHPVKIVTTGEGGVATTNSFELANRMNLLRSHGITRNPEEMKKNKSGDWYYEQIGLGFNYRMTEMQAALGVSQMQRVEQFVSSRHSIANRYSGLLEGLPITLPFQSASSYSAFHLYPILIHHNEIKKDKAQVFSQLRDNGIGVNIHYIPVHTQPYYQDLGFSEGDYPIAEEYYRGAISIPIFHGMTNEQQDKVVSVLREVLK